MSATIAAMFSAIAAGISAYCAILTYRHIARTHDDAEAEERLIAGRPAHPSLREHDHSQAVIYCALFNKSKKKAAVNDVLAFDGSGNKVEITWSDQIDELGNPIAPSQLVGLTDSCHVYARRNDGEWFSYAQLKIFHSFRNSPLVVIFDPTAQWKD